MKAIPSIILALISFAVWMWRGGEVLAFTTGMLFIFALIDIAEKD